MHGQLEGGGVVPVVKVQVFGWGMAWPQASVAVTEAVKTVADSLAG